MDEAESGAESAGEQAITCYRCDATIWPNDLTYRVIYGRADNAAAMNISEQHGPIPVESEEEIEEGARSRYWCFDCYQEHREREKGAHYRYEDADELWAILDAADGRLVADTLPVTIGGRGWFRIEDGELQARYATRSVTEDGIMFTTEPLPEAGRAYFSDTFDGAEDDRRMVYLKPVRETPFTAGMNRTLAADYTEES